jgi:hypothetical protein
MANPRKIFVNLAVTDLQRSLAFFRGLGFEFNPKFTDENAACMVLSEDGYVMLLRREFFARFTNRTISDPQQATECLIAVSCESKAAVDEMVEKAAAAGGAKAMPPQDHGWMYQSSFYDPDGHHWEVLWTDPAAEF